MNENTTKFREYTGDPARKAWVVADHDRERCCIRFGESYPKVRREGASEIGLSYEEVTCERYPELDGFEGDACALMHALLERGWWFECHGVCQYTRCSEDTGCVVHDGAVYCSATCLDAARKKHAEEEARRQRTVARAGQLFPGCTFERPYTSVAGDHLVTVIFPDKDAISLKVPEPAARTDAELEELLRDLYRLHVRATQPGWLVKTQGFGMQRLTPVAIVLGDTDSIEWRDADYELICKARNELAALLEAVSETVRARREISELRTLLDEARDMLAVHPDRVDPNRPKVTELCDRISQKVRTGPGEELGLRRVT